MIQFIRSIFSGLLALLFLLTGCIENANQKSAADSIPESEQGTSLLWQISGKGLKKPSYLYGTIHLIPANDFFTGKYIEQALSESEVLVMEVANINDLGASLSLTNDMFLDSGTMADYLDQDRFQRLIDAVDEHLGIDSTSFMTQYGRFKPFGLYTLTMQMESLMQSNLKSYEKYFIEQAFHHEIPTNGLETLDYQMSLFNAISYEDAVDNLLKGFEEGNDDGGFADMVKLYKTNNLDALLEYMTSSGDMMMDKHRDAFLDNRNRNWIPKIGEMIQDKTCFIAVGAAHLPGDQGVINLLRNEGYTVTPLQID